MAAMKDSFNINNRIYTLNRILYIAVVVNGEFNRPFGTDINTAAAPSAFCSNYSFAIDQLNRIYEY